MRTKILILLVILAVVFMGGCGNSDQFPLATVQGVVLCDGEPVPYVQVYFQPAWDGGDVIVGKQGVGITDANGKFNISTYRPNDGAVIGKHEIRIGVSVGTLPDNPADLSNGKTLEIVEVKKGMNEFTFTLPKRNPRQRLILPVDD